MTPKSGKFITLEGGEGSGKTTCLNYLHDLLTQNEIAVVVTREPGGTKMAEAIRELLLATTDEPIAEETELLLMFASRAQHVKNIIKPALNQGKWVLCSRFADSSYAYQGGGRGIDTAKIQLLESLVHGDLTPDLTLLLDVPVELGIERAKARAALDRIEQEQIDFFERVRAAYLNMATSDERFVIIDATKPFDVVFNAIASIVKPLIAKNL